MPLRGSIGQLRDLSARLRMVQDGAVAELAAQRITGAMLKLSADQFKAEMDPYGQGWAKLKRERPRNRKARQRLEKRLAKLRRLEELNNDSFLESANVQRKLAAAGGKVGQDTGRMRASFFAHAEGSKVIIGYPVKYAPWFSGGTRNQAARKLIPDERGLGNWGPIIQREADAAFAQILRGR